MDVIHVGLYGGKSIFGGRETKLNADVISCDRYNECSFYKIGQCLKIRKVSGCGCKYGRKINHVGYTSRARKYWDFERKWEEHPAYGKLKSVNKTFGVVGDYVLIDTPFVGIEEDGSLITGAFTNKCSWIPKDKFTTEMLFKICNDEPQAMMGGTIRSHKKEEVPKLLIHVKEAMPEFYEKFIKEYPVFDKEIDYTGRKVLLRTVKPNSIVTVRDDKWLWTGERLIWESGGKFLGSFSDFKKHNVIKCELKPNDDMAIKITDNSQVTEETVILD